MLLDEKKRDIRTFDATKYLDLMNTDGVAAAQQTIADDLGIKEGMVSNVVGGGFCSFWPSVFITHSTSTGHMTNFGPRCVRPTREASVRGYLERLISAENAHITHHGMNKKFPIIPLTGRITDIDLQRYIDIAAKKSKLAALRLVMRDLGLHRKKPSYFDRGAHLPPEWGERISTFIEDIGANTAHSGPVCLVADGGTARMGTDRLFRQLFQRKAPLIISVGDSVTRPSFQGNDIRRFRFPPASTLHK